MATTKQHVDDFEVTLATWATILLAASPVISTDITAGLWSAQDLETCELQISNNRIFIETKRKTIASGGGITTRKRYRYYVPWADVQPFLGVFSTTPADAFDSVNYDPVALVMSFIFKAVNG